MYWQCLFVLFLVGVANVSAEPLQVYIGTYGRGPGQGIHLLELDPTTGQLTNKGLAIETERPSFLAWSPDRRRLAAVSEMGRDGAVVLFERHQTPAKWVSCGIQPSGGGACHVAFDATGKVLMAANYGGGSVASFPIMTAGSLGDRASFILHAGPSKVNPQRQEAPHVHSVTLDPTKKLVVVADLGCDKLFLYRVGDDAMLTPHDPPFAATEPGAGPRHFAFHPNGQLGFAINELNNTITSYRYDQAKGLLTPIESKSTLPSDFQGPNTTAEVRVHPNGKFVYGSNRGHDSIAIFAVDPATGRLTPRGHTSTQGKTPRNFNIDDHGKFLLAANQNTNNVVAFRINDEGSLTPTGSSVTVPSPVCVLFGPR